MCTQAGERSPDFRTKMASGNETPVVLVSCTQVYSSYCMVDLHTKSRRISGCFVDSFKSLHRIPSLLPCRTVSTVVSVCKCKRVHGSYRVYTRASLMLVRGTITSTVGVDSTLLSLCQCPASTRDLRETKSLQLQTAAMLELDRFTFLHAHSTKMSTWSDGTIVSSRRRNGDVPPLLQPSAHVK